jgi:hypothetical protein
VQYDPETGSLLDCTWLRAKRSLWKLMTSREFRDEYNGLGEEAKAAYQLERNGLEGNGLGRHSIALKPK